MPRPLALVTGTSSGLGRELARSLAARGHGLVLTARDAHVLGEVAVELEKEHGTVSEVIAADLAAPEGLAAVVARLGQGDVDVLVNSAGVGFFGTFASQPPAEVAALVELDVVALTVLSHAAVVSMTRRRRGAILNVSSIASFSPGPYSAIYHAAKAYVTYFSEALHEEVRREGVSVTALCPGPTPTQFQARAGARSDGLVFRWWSSDVRQVASQAIDALERNDALCIPGAVNRFAAVASRLTPRGVLRCSAGAVVQRLVQAHPC